MAKMQILAVVGVKDAAASLDRIARDVEQAAVDVMDETLVPIEVTRRGAECRCGPGHWSRRCTSAGLAEWGGRGASPSDSVLAWGCGALGRVDPSLQGLEKQGLIGSDWGTTDNNRRARYYRLTPSGRRVLGEEINSWRRFADGLGAVFRST